jgi:hypothetical protein
MAPLLVLILRLLQGLALVVNMAEPQPMWPSMPCRTTRILDFLIQTTATVGLFISLMVILATRNILTPEQFDEWGWRVPLVIHSYGWSFVFDS